MQLVLPVGGNTLKFDVLNNALSNIGKRVVNHQNELAKLASIWEPNKDQESLIRGSGMVADHIYLSFLVVCPLKSMMLLSSLVKAIMIESEESHYFCLCTASLSRWQRAVVHLLKEKHANKLGQLLLAELDKQGYSGLFHNFSRTKQDNQLLLLEYKK